MKPTIRKRTLPHPWLQNQWNARWTLRTCQTSLQCAWLISCIMLHGYMFSIRSRDWIPVPAEISAGTGIPPYGILNLILLISRDAIHMVVCRYTHRAVAFLYLDDWGILQYARFLVLPDISRWYRDRDIKNSSSCTSLAITLSLSESVARSYSSLIWGLL